LKTAALNAFAGLFTLISVVLFLLAVAFDISHLSPSGASPGLFFAGGCVFLVLAVVFGLWRARSMRY
jgi:protein-S-isoprenylcysteine O-methyltransferase Ste14